MRTKDLLPLMVAPSAIALLGCPTPVTSPTDKVINIAASKKRTIALIVFALIAVCTYGADKVINLWGDGDSYTAIILSGKQFYIQDERGKRGPYAQVFPFQSEDGSRRAWGAEGDKKKGYTLIGDDGQRFGPYKNIRWGTGRDNLYGDMKAQRAGVLICERLQGDITTYFFSDGKRLSLMSSVDGAGGGSTHFSRDEKLAAIESQFHDWEIDKRVISIGSSNVIVPSKWVIPFGFRGDPESFWYAYGIEYSMGKDDTGNPKSRTIYNLMSISRDAPDRAVCMVQGIEAFGSGTEQLRLSDDRSGIIIKYQTAEGGFIFTGHQILGPFECDEEWLEKEFHISPDGKELVYSYKKDGSWYIDFLGSLVGPFESITSSPWSSKDEPDKVLALVTKGGKAYAYLNGQEVGGPWDSAKRLCTGEDISFFLAETGGEFHLYRYCEKVAGPFSKGSLPTYAVSYGGRLAILMHTGEEWADREWVVLDGEAQNEFYNTDYPRFSPDGRTVAYSAYDDYRNGSSFTIYGDKKIGPYDLYKDGPIAFYRDGCAFVFQKNGKYFLGKSDGSTVALPVCSLALEEELVVSDDGRIVQFAADYPDETAIKPRRVNRVVVDGKVYVGFYDVGSKNALIWDEKTKEVKRVATGR